MSNPRQIYLDTYPVSTEIFLLSANNGEIKIINKYENTKILLFILLMKQDLI